VPLPRVDRVASLVKGWLLGTHQGVVEADHLQAYLNVLFRFNRRNSRSRGMLFTRLLQLSARAPPVTYSSLVVNPNHKAVTPKRRQREDGWPALRRSRSHDHGARPLTRNDRGAGASRWIASIYKAPPIKSNRTIGFMAHIASRDRKHSTGLSSIVPTTDYPQLVPQPILGRSSQSGLQHRHALVPYYALLVAHFWPFAGRHSVPDRLEARIHQFTTSFLRE